MLPKTMKAAVEGGNSGSDRYGDRTALTSNLVIDI
jgi:hypothetical protein